MQIWLKKINQDAELQHPLLFGTSSFFLFQGYGPSPYQQSHDQGDQTTYEIGFPRKNIGNEKSVHAPPTQSRARTVGCRLLLPFIDCPTPPC